MMEEIHICISYVKKDEIELSNCCFLVRGEFVEESEFPPIEY